MLQVLSLDARDPLPVVDHFRPGLNQSVKHNISIEVDNRHAGQSVPLFRQNALTVQRQDFSLPEAANKELARELIYILTCHA